MQAASLARAEDVVMQSAPQGDPAAQLEEEEPSKVFLSVIFQNNRLGCAFYDTKSCVLRITEVHEDTNWSLLQLSAHLLIADLTVSVKLEANPTQIITTSKADTAFLEALRQPCPFLLKLRLLISAVDEGSPPISVTVQVASEYAFESCKSRLLLLSPPDMPTGLSAPQRYSFISRDIDFDAVQMVRAAGALLGFLHKNRDTERNHRDDSVTISSIDNHCLEHSLHLDVSTLKALQVFKDTGRGGSANKEGMSLFKLLNHTKSIPGTRLLRKWMLRPLRSIPLIEERLSAVAAFVNLDNETLAATLRSRLAKVRDITIAVCKIRKVSYNVADWKALFDSVTNGAMVVRALGSTASSDDSVPFFRKFLSVDIEALEALLHTMNSVLDLEESKIEGRLVPKSGVNAQLDELKHTYAGFDSLLTDIGAEELRRYPPISTLKVVYLPQIGYEIALPVDEKQGPQLSYPGTDLEYQFHTTQYVYFKSPRCRELDEYLGDIHYIIAELESAIIRELEKLVLEHSGLLLQLANLLAELDCMATAARMSKWTRPVLTAEPELYIVGGRHPLQELCVSTFIPNNTSMSTVREGMLKLISGPNGSGKSVYVKQVGLIALMAHIGCYVPAESAKIGLMDQIFTRISSRETVSVSQSSFMLDLMQITGMLRKASAHSLLLVDEFGKGTNTEDGLALLAAVVKHLLARQVACPRTLFTTHFTELVDYKLLTPEPNLELLTMDVMPGEEKGGIDMGRVFLYKLVSGWSSATYALACASSAGVPSEILQRAEEITRCIRQGIEVTRLENLQSISLREYHMRIAKLFFAFDVEHGDIRQFALSLPEPPKEQ